MTYHERYQLSSTHWRKSQEQSLANTAHFTSQNGTAIVLGTWDGFHWSQDDIQHLQAMITPV